ncbi:bola-like protein [Amanita muscaria]
MNSLASPSLPGPVELSIRQKLKSILQPSFIRIQNDSWKHRHHAAMQEQGGGSGETHFTILVVSDAFKGKNTMKRHRMVYAALAEELSKGLHALSLQTKTVDESDTVQAVV